MPFFEYSGTDTEGKVVRGTIVATDLAQASSLVQAQGVTLNSIQHYVQSYESGPGPTVNTGINPPEAVTRPREEIMMQRPAIVAEFLAPIFAKVPLSAIYFFFKQLATMTKAGISPMMSLESLSTQSTSPKLRTIINELREHAIAGRPMSFGMQRYPEVFTPLMMSLVRVGESGGFPDKSFNLIADYIDNEIRLRNLMRRVTIYPKIVLALSVVIIMAANSIIKAVAPSAPIALDNPMARIGFWICAGPVFIGLFIFLRAGLQNPRIRYWWDAFLLKIPNLGKTVHQFAMAKFGRALGALYQGGVPIHDAFKLSADACGNEFIRARIHENFRRLEQGDGIVQTMNASGVFDPIVLNMAATGEATGNLDAMLNNMSDYYEGEAEVRSTQAGYVAGALVLLGVAVFIGFIYVSNMSNIIGGSIQAASQ